MDSASIQFILFGLATAVLSNFSSSRPWRSGVLLIASAVFLEMLYPNAYSVLPLVGFLLLGYMVVAALEKHWLNQAAWGIIVIIFAYIWLKKYTFLPGAIFLRFSYSTIGLSYIFFRILHLVIESGDRTRARLIRPHEFLLFTLNFTTFVSGPIQQYEDFARDQFADNPISLNVSEIGLQLERIVRGFFKVNVLAMILHSVQQASLARIAEPLPETSRFCSVIIIAVVYPLFLYANFSGYIDIVIALARLMRVSLPENFDRPFAASSFIDFWNRWHITLSNWLKTYVYNPLLMALMRRIPSADAGPYIGVFAFFVTFFLVGIWHGRTSEFFVFGVLQGGGVAINKLWQVWLVRRTGRKKYRELASNAIYTSVARGLTFSWFAFTLFWFWADWKQIGHVFAAIGPVLWTVAWFSIWMCATLALAFWEQLRGSLLSVKTKEGPIVTSRYARIVYASALGVCAFVITVLLSQPAPGIVYKSF